MYGCYVCNKVNYSNKNTLVDTKNIPLLKFKEAFIMNFQLTKEQEFVRKMVREFAVN